MYSATYDCPHCGQIHLVAGGGLGLGLVIENGPTRTGTVAVAGKLNSLTWCDAVGDYVLMDDPGTITIFPPGAVLWQ